MGDLGRILKLLCISNGHGEDAIALPVLEELRRLANPPTEIVALPIVGLGKAYSDGGFRVIGTVATMPSGGFNQDGRQLVRDLQGGLVGLTIDQIRTVKNWAQSGGKILAVGDLVPLLFAWWSGAEYAFIGTAKSEYYIRDRSGQILPSQRNSIEVKTGCYYFPWERWLLSRSRCRAVFPRDRLTSEILQKYQIPAFDLGNPMTDGVKFDGAGVLPQFDRAFTIVLLPGSRPPEAYDNWAKIIIAANSLISVDRQRSLLFLAACTTTLDLGILQGILTGAGWMQMVDQRGIYYRRENATLMISTHAYAECLHLGDCAIAMAGTATEQFISLGQPAFIIPGSGPQFTPAFAEAQTRLLGESVILVSTPENVGREIDRLFQQPDKLRSIASNGRLRMGIDGAAKRIADRVIDLMDTPFLLKD